MNRDNPHITHGGGVRKCCGDIPVRKLPEEEVKQGSVIVPDETTKSLVDRIRSGNHGNKNGESTQ
jgi:hypothetical protein